MFLSLKFAKEQINKSREKLNTVLISDLDLRNSDGRSLVKLSKRKKLDPNCIYKIVEFGGGNFIFLYNQFILLKIQWLELDTKKNMPLI